jgi:hypothetical protein
MMVAAGTRAIGGAAALTVALVAPSVAATITSSAGKDAHVIIQISGEISEGDTETFIEIVKRANAAGKLVANVRLNSTGGNLLEGVKLADAIRAGKISTNVGRSATCASACFLAFAAGDTKFASYGAQIGVHGASDQSGRETVQSSAATVSMARVAKDLGVSSAIIGRMVVTPPSEVVWLSPQDLQSMGVTMVGKPLQTQPLANGTPIDQIPGPPTSLAPGASSTRASTTPSWNEFMDKVINLSAGQNNGKAAFTRFCQPEFKTCTIAVAYTLRTGKSGFAKMIEDIDGKTLRREICELNDFKDVRDCVDWDNGTNHRDMKNEKGDWIQVN